MKLVHSGVASEKLLVMLIAKHIVRSAPTMVGAERKTFYNLGPLDRRKRPFQTQFSALCRRNSLKFIQKHIQKYKIV